MHSKNMKKICHQMIIFYKIGKTMERFIKAKD